MNYYGDSKLLRRSIFSMAGSFGQGQIGTNRDKRGQNGTFRDKLGNAPI